jgi:hypothetical protein
MQLKPPAWCFLEAANIDCSFLGPSIETSMLYSPSFEAPRSQTAGLTKVGRYKNYLHFAITMDHFAIKKGNPSITLLELIDKMRINSLLLTTILIGIGQAAMSAEEITKCLSDTATQFTDLDAKAQRINLSTFIGLQNVSKNTTSPTRKSQLNSFVTPGHHLRLLSPHQPREGLRRPDKPGSRIPRLRHRATAADLRRVQIRKSTFEKPSLFITLYPLLLPASPRHANTC